MVFCSKVSTRLFQWENLTIWLFINISIIPFQLILLPQLWISLPFPLMIVPVPKNDPGIPLIRFQLPFLLPLETMLVHWSPLPIPHNFLNQIMMIMTLTIPSWVTTLYMAGQKEDTAPGFMVEKYATKNLGSIAPHIKLTRELITVMDLSEWVHS